MFFEYINVRVRASKKTCESGACTRAIIVSHFHSDLTITRSVRVRRDISVSGIVGWSCLPLRSQQNARVIAPCQSDFNRSNTRVRDGK